MTRVPTEMPEGLNEQEQEMWNKGVPSKFDMEITLRRIALLRTQDPNGDFTKRLHDLVTGYGRIDMLQVLKRLMTHGGGLEAMLGYIIKDLREALREYPQNEFYLRPMIAKLEEALAVYKARNDEEIERDRAVLALDNQRQHILEFLASAESDATPQQLYDELKKSLPSSSEFYEFKTGEDG